MTLSIASRRVQAARTALVLDEPFFGVLALQLRLQDDPTCPTAWVDGRTLGYNPAFVATLSDAELQGLICHEVLHCACGHPWRRGARDHKRFNVACDYAINPIVQAAGMKLPDCALIDAQYSGHYAEWIYDRLPQPQPQPEPSDDDQDGDGDGDGQPSDDPSDGDGDGDGDGDQSGQAGTPDSNVPDDPTAQPGEVRDAPTGADAPSESDWQEHARQAEKIAQAHGKLPGGMSRGLGQAAAPKTDWRSALRRFVQESCKADYSWSRPNVRYLSAGFYLPSLHAVQCGRIAVGVDTSGSIDDVLLAQFGAELQAIAEDVQPASVDVVYCDSEVNHAETFERGDVITLTAHGGGGTAFAPVFDHVNEQSDAPAVLVYLTDLCGPMPDVAPDYPVLWAVTGDYGRHVQVPFGEVLPID
jgi:predicted metal-dependent peptidase